MTTRENKRIAELSNKKRNADEEEELRRLIRISITEKQGERMGMD